MTCAVIETLIKIIIIIIIEVRIGVQTYVITN